MTVVGILDKLQCSEIELFCAWLARKPIAELSHMSGLEPSEIMWLAQKHDWLGHMAVLPVDRQIGHSDAIKVNRTRNLALFEKLRAHVDTMVDKLAAGELKFGKPMKTKEGVEIAEVGPTTADILNLASAIKTISEGTAKCLGDVVSMAAPKSAGQAQSAAQEIVVNLPAVLGPGSATLPVDLLAPALGVPENARAS